MTYSNIYRFLKISIIVLSLFIGVKQVYAQEVIMYLNPSTPTVTSIQEYCDRWFSSTQYQTPIDIPGTVPLSYNVNDYCPPLDSVVWESIYRDSHSTKTLVSNECISETNTLKNIVYDSTSWTQLKCVGSCDIPVPDGYIYIKSKATIEECNQDGYWCGCPTEIDPVTLFNLYRIPSICDADPNSHEVSGGCVCNDTYTLDPVSGLCSLCYELVKEPYYKEFLLKTTYAECTMDGVGKSPYIGSYISNAFWKDCLDGCVVGVEYCPVGEQVNDTNNDCIPTPVPPADTNCSGWVKTGFLDLRGGGVNFGYPEHVVPPHCYNKYDCQDDFTIVKYVETSCGIQEDTNTSTDPNDAENQTDPTAPEEEGTFDANATLPEHDINSTAGSTQVVVSELKKINEKLLTVSDTLKEGFKDMKSDLAGVKDGLDDIGISVDGLGSKVDGVKDGITDLGKKIDTTNTKLDEIKEKLTDPNSESDYSDFVSGAVMDSFNSFSGHGILPFSSVVAGVPTINYNYHGHNNHLLDADKLSSVDWSFLRGMLLFLAAISAFHRIFSNV